MSQIQRDAVIRSNLYKLFSIGFRYPTQEVFKKFQNGEFLDELMYNISLIPKLNVNTKECLLIMDNETLKKTTFAEFEMKFICTFDSGLPVPPCSPYEGHYSGMPRSMVLLEVSEFYKSFGLRMNQDEGKREFPDHICAELEFLHFLTFKEGNAPKEELKSYLLAQKEFLERHMIQWIPKLCIKLQNTADTTFHARLAQIVSRFMSIESESMTSNMIYK